LEDTKIPINQVWLVLSKLLPRTRLQTYNKDTYVDPTTSKPVDTQHEINTNFIDQINQIDNN